jgi:hypothetical protein
MSAAGLRGQGPAVPQLRVGVMAGGPGSGEPVITKPELPRQNCAAMVVGGPRSAEQIQLVETGLGVTAPPDTGQSFTPTVPPSTAR